MLASINLFLRQINPFFHLGTIDLDTNHSKQYSLCLVRVSLTNKAVSYGKLNQNKTNHLLPNNVDTMVSTSVPCFVLQPRGKPFNKRFFYATLFVDAFSKLNYVVLYKRNDMESIVYAKPEFECFAVRHDISIKRYHCNNRIFEDFVFYTACVAFRQQKTFCGTNTRHQNGFAERNIRDLCDSARSMLLFTKHRWTKVITCHLLDFVLKYAVMIKQHAVHHKSTYLLLQLFSGITTTTTQSFTDLRTFGYPTYSLDNNLRTGLPQPNKWMDRSWLGIDLSISRDHVITVSLILNPSTD